MQVADSNAYKFGTGFGCVRYAKKQQACRRAPNVSLAWGCALRGGNTRPIALQSIESESDEGAGYCGVDYRAKASYSCAKVVDSNTYKFGTGLVAYAMQKNTYSLWIGVWSIL